MEYREIKISDTKAMAELFVKSFNTEPWNDNWTIETASKRLGQMINTEDSYGILAYKEDMLCGMVLGCEEQYYNGIMFNLKEFCVSNDMRNSGLGTIIITEFENRLKDRGIKEIVLLTSRGAGTEGFYNRRGFKSYEGMVMMGKEI